MSDKTKGARTGERHLKQGIITVEAALVLPMFLVAMITVGCILNMYYTHLVVGETLDNTARTIVSWAYPYRSLGDSKQLDMVSSGFSGNAKDTSADGEVHNSFSLVKTGSSAALSTSVTAGVRKDSIAGGMLKGAVNCLYSTPLSNNGIVDLVAIYELKVPFGMFMPKGMKFVQRSRMHAWTGYINDEGDEDNSDVEYVFVTTNGTVYHRSESCTYLKPSVKGVNASGVKNLRNSSGAKYYACEYCHPSVNSGGKLYITTYGTRYHSSSHCSAIERNYKRVPLSQVEGVLPPCSKCGK